MMLGRSLMTGKMNGRALEMEPVGGETTPVTGGIGERRRTAGLGKSLRLLAKNPGMEGRQGSSSHWGESQQSWAWQKPEQEGPKKEEKEVEEGLSKAGLKNNKKRPKGSGTVSHARRARFQNKHDSGERCHAEGGCEDQLGLLVKGCEVDHDMIHSFSSSSGGSSLDKRKPKKLQEWVKEEFKEGAEEASPCQCGLNGMTRPRGRRRKTASS